MGLTACSPTLRAGWQTVEQAWATPTAVRHSRLDPALLYLLVHHQDREALLVWVGDEPGPLGLTRVWVGADGVVLRTAQGRLVGVAEPTRNWRLISQDTPVASGSSTTVTQTVNMQPGHRLGLRVPLQRRPLSSAPSPTRWLGDATGLRWEEERPVDAARPPIWLARDAQGHVVYGQQCLAVDWCLSWQTWPTDQTAAPHSDPKASP